MGQGGLEGMETPRKFLVHQFNYEFFCDCILSSFWTNTVSFFLITRTYCLLYLGVYRATSFTSRQR